MQVLCDGMCDSDELNDCVVLCDVGQECVAMLKRENWGEKGRLNGGYSRTPGILTVLEGTVQ